MTQFINDVGGDAASAYVPLTLDSSGKYAISVDSLPVAYTYDGAGNLATETRGPDLRGFSYRKTYTFTNGALSAESAWVKQ